MDNSCGERIRRFRKIADLTQEELAEECEVSIQYDISLGTGNTFSERRSLRGFVQSF